MNYVDDIRDNLYPVREINENTLEGMVTYSQVEASGEAVEAAGDGHRAGE